MGKRIFVFIVGGATRSELRVCHHLTTKLRREIVLGSSSLDDPAQFVEVLCDSLFIYYLFNNNNNNNNNNNSNSNSNSNTDPSTSNNRGFFSLQKVKLLTPNDNEISLDALELLRLDISNL
ncbi:putative sec1-like protein [Helianthus anomalus]